jgi:hypothetical protein
MLPETKMFLIMFSIADLLLFGNVFMFVWNISKGSLIWMLSIVASGFIIFAIYNATSMYIRLLAARQEAFEEAHLYVNETGTR